MSKVRITKWTEVEDAILDKYYAKEGSKGCKDRGIDRSLNAIKVRANSKGLKREKVRKTKSPVWSVEERNILSQYFKMEGIKGVISRGVMKSPTLICLEAKKLGLY